MKNLKINYKVLLLTIIPLTLMLTVLLSVSISQIRSLGQSEIVQIRQTMIESKRDALKQTLTIVKSLIMPIIKSDLPEDVIQQKVDQTLRAIRYSHNNGYVFAIDYDGITHIQPAKEHLEGKSVLDLEDEEGTRFIEKLISVARNGGGYVEYKWKKPSIEQVAPKLAYAIDLKEFGWVLGTGFYIDDINVAIQREQRMIEEDVAAMTNVFLIAGVGILVVVAFVTMWVSNSILARPLKELSESARQMSLGNMHAEITTASNDEIGELADVVKRIQKSWLVLTRKLAKN